MENGRENATQLSRMIFYIVRNPFSNLNISCLVYFYRKPIFRHCLLKLRRVKQASIGNRFSYARTNVLVKDHKASFYKSEIRSVYQVENNLQPKGVFFRKFLSQISPIVDVQILFAKTGKCVNKNFFTHYKVRLTVYALIHERNHDKYVKTSRQIILYIRPV